MDKILIISQNVAKANEGVAMLHSVGFENVKIVYPGAKDFPNRDSKETKHEAVLS